MTSHLNNHGTTDIKPEMLSGVQTRNKYNICGIAHACTNRKDDICMQRRLVQNFILDLFIDEAHTALEFPACCLVRFAAFLCYSFDNRI